MQSPSTNPFDKTYFICGALCGHLPFSKISKTLFASFVWCATCNYKNKRRTGGRWSVRIFHHKALHNAKTYTLKQAAKLTDDAHAHTLLITRWKMEATIANNNNKATISYYIISPGDKLCNNRLQQHSIASLFH
jgi:hypothetical protein